MGDRARGLAELLAAIAILGALLGMAWSVWLPVRVTGGSMHPALNAGDLVIVRRDARPREGSVVLARADGHGAVLHRVVTIEHDGAVTTRGDANPVNDVTTTSQQDVAGVAVRVVRVGTLFRRWRGAE